MSNKEMRERVKAITDEILREQAARIEKEAKAFPVWSRIAKIPSPGVVHAWFDEGWRYGTVVVSSDGGTKAMIVDPEARRAIILDSDRSWHLTRGVVTLEGKWQRIVDHIVLDDDAITYKVGFDPGRPVKIRITVAGT